jgi:DNA repair protein RadD
MELWAVVQISYTEHRKEGKPVSLRVAYTCEGFGKRISEFLCFEHEGFAKAVAKCWWQTHCGKQPAPKTAFEARIRIVDCGELRRIVELVVDPALDQDWPIVVGYRHEGGRLLVRQSALIGGRR